MAAPSIFGGPGFQPDDVLLLQLQFGGVLNGDNALAGMNLLESAFSSVVFPEPVPPDTMILRRQRAEDFQGAGDIAREIDPAVTRCEKLSICRENLRIDMRRPVEASGGMMMLTRLPSGSRASSMGSSRRRAPDRGSDALRHMQHMGIMPEPQSWSARACRASRHRSDRAR